MEQAQRKKIEQLYKQMFFMMKTYAQCNLDNDHLAEEAVQETFRIACQKPDDLCESNNPRGWLVNTLKYTIMNMNTNYRTTQRLLDRLVHRDTNRHHEDELDVHLLYEDVASTDDFQLLVEMVEEGRTHLEMSQRRGISVDACKKRVQRAKEALRKKIEK